MNDRRHSADSASQSPLVSAPPTRERRDTIDFWRGFVLCTIFVNHVPGNMFERLTFKNYGFSDSAEAFVFISGVSLALAYGRRVIAGEDEQVVLSLGRRAVKLYAVHILLSLIGLAIFAIGASVTANAALMQVHGRDLMIDQPISALIGLLSMGHQFGYFNILPLYVLLVAMAPILFWLARISSLLMLTMSFAIYVAARHWGLNVPSWPMKGEWFFDPFTWQFLMAIGLAVGLELRTAASVPPSRVLMAACVVVLALGVVCVTDGFSLLPGLYDQTRAVADIDKTTLGLGRIVHFLALAYLVSVWGIAERLRPLAIYQPLCLIGRHGLVIFAVLSLLAAFGQVLAGRFGHPVLLDVAVICGGLFALHRCARLLRDRPPAFAPALASSGLASSGLRR